MSNPTDTDIGRLKRFADAFHVSHAFTSALRKAGYAPEGDWDDASREFVADLRALLERHAHA